MPSPIPSPEIERWRPLAMALSMPRATFSLPFETLLGESIDVSKFADEHWSTERDASGAIARRGLDLVAGRPGTLVAPGIGSDIFSLVQATSHANRNYLLEVEKLKESPLKRGLAVLDEIRTTVEYYFSVDGVDDAEDERVLALAEAHPASEHYTMDGLAVALENYAGFAAMHRDVLQGFGGFDAASIDAASALAVELRARPQTPETKHAAAREARDLRDRLLTLLLDRVRAVRAAARFVFRDEPEVVREVASAAERRKRAESRRAAASKKPAPTE